MTAAQLRAREAVAILTATWTSQTETDDGFIYESWPGFKQNTFLRTGMVDVIERAIEAAIDDTMFEVREFWFRDHAGPGPHLIKILDARARLEEERCPGCRECSSSFAETGDCPHCGPLEDRWRET